MKKIFHKITDQNIGEAKLYLEEIKKKKNLVKIYDINSSEKYGFHEAIFHSLFSSKHSIIMHIINE